MAFLVSLFSVIITERFKQPKVRLSTKKTLCPEQNSNPRPRILAIPKFCRKLGRVSNFNKSINGHHNVKDHDEIGHLTKFDAFRMNRDQVMDLEIWFKIDTNVSNFEKASPKTI